MRFILLSGCRDSNPESPVPKTGMLAVTPRSVVFFPHLRLGWQFNTNRLCSIVVDMKNQNFWLSAVVVIFIIGAIFCWSWRDTQNQVPGAFQEPTSAPYVTPPPGPPQVTQPTTPPPNNPATYRNPFQPPAPAN